MSSGNRDKIQVLQKAMEILTVLTDGSLSVRALAERTGVTKPAVYRILHTLETKNFVRRDENSREYMLGDSLINLGKGRDRRLNLPRLISPYMEALLKKYDETINLGILEGDKILYLHSIESTQRLRPGNPNQERDFVHSTALGKAILSTLDTEALTKKINSLDLRAQTDKTIKSAQELYSAISLAKKIGFAIDDQENEMGSRCVAVAIKNKKGDAICALSITGPASRMSTEKIRNIGKNLKSVANQLTFKLVN